MALVEILIIIVLAFVVAIFFSLDKVKNFYTPAPVMNNSVPIPSPEITGSESGVKVAEPANFPPALGIDRQYQNVHVNMKDRHPVLQYQFSHNKGITPATIGDPIRIPDVAGPEALYPHPAYDSLVIRPQARPYGEDYPGPYPGVPLGLPVPAGALRATADGGYGYLSNLGGMFPYQNKPLIANDFSRPFTSSAAVGSVDAYAPFPSVNTPWEKAGILTSSNNDILNLYRRPIAPGQDLWEYQVQDKDGFIIKLQQTRYLEDGDEVRHIIGKHGLGPWRVSMFVQNRYVWV